MLEGIMKAVEASPLNMRSRDATLSAFGQIKRARPSC